MVDCAAEQLVQRLRRQVQRHERRQRPPEPRRCSSGCSALDQLLPVGGWVAGSLVEWLSSATGGGAATLALWAAHQIAREGGALVVMDRRQEFYLPAAAALGVDLERLIVVRASSEREELWALDQALRCTAVAAVWAQVGPQSSAALRRLQLAAEQGGGVGLLVRPARVRGQPCWSDLQLLVQPRVAQGPVRRLRVELVRGRNVQTAGAVELEMDEVTGTVRAVRRAHETHPLHLVTQLAPSAAGRRSAGA